MRPAGSAEGSVSYFDLWRDASGYPWNKYTLLYQIPMSWGQAKAACENVGLSLANVLNAAEQEAVMAFGHTVWLGYRCVDHR